MSMPLPPCSSKPVPEAEIAHLLGTCGTPVALPLVGGDDLLLDEALTWRLSCSCSSVKGTATSFGDYKTDASV
jgi:hypothetical protein